MTTIVDRTAWGRLRVTGGDRVRFLQGLTTVNAEQLADGGHGWGAILNPKGRVLAVIDIARVGDAFVIACEPDLTDKTRQILERYAVMDDVAFEPITGPAHQLWDDPTSVWRAPIIEGASEASRDDRDPEVERLRIRAGFLRYGIDVDEDHFPFETPLAQFLDYGKGCYVGQEPVFRVHAQGNAAKSLRGLEIEGAAAIRSGATIKHPAKDNAGTLTSSVIEGDRVLALGYLHRSCWTPGDQVEVEGRPAIVRELPLVTTRGLGLGLGLGFLASGCSLLTDSFVTNDFSGDPFPIQVETQSGAVVLGVRQAGSPDRLAVLDLLSPVTLVDPGPTKPPSVSTSDLVLLGQRGAGGMLDLPRAHLTSAQVVALHPCDDPSCVVGTEASPRPYDAIIGADALAGDAVRLRLGDDQIFVLADVGGEQPDRARACDAVFPAPYRGGGTLVIGGTELAFGGRRVAIQACLGPDPDPLVPQSLRGANALLVMSTGIGVSLLTESAYNRYRVAQPLALPFESLPFSGAYLPSGLTQGRLATIPALALVATSSLTPRAPCRQVYGSHLLVVRDCVAEDDCPCESGLKFCPMPAVVEMAPAAGIDVLIVADSDPTLQALRTELRPDQPEVDGILGATALRTLEVDVDYPHNRVLARCSSGECSTRPELTGTRDRDQVAGCLAGGPAGPLF